jgi:hypothetical protein
MSRRLRKCGLNAGIIASNSSPASTTSTRVSIFSQRRSPVYSTTGRTGCKESPASDVCFSSQARFCIL